MLEDMPKKTTQDPDAWPPVVRIPEGTRDRLKRVADALSKRALTELPAAVVVRAVLDRGLDDLEGELGIKRAK